MLSPLQADVRQPDGKVLSWSISADVEALTWNPSQPTSFLVSSEDGLVVAFDARKGAGGLTHGSGVGGGGKRRAWHGGLSRQQLCLCWEGKGCWVVPGSVSSMCTTANWHQTIPQMSPLALLLADGCHTADWMAILSLCCSCTEL